MIMVAKCCIDLLFVVCSFFKLVLHVSLVLPISDVAINYVSSLSLLITRYGSNLTNSDVQIMPKWNLNQKLMHRLTSIFGIRRKPVLTTTK